MIEKPNILAINDVSYIAMWMEIREMRMRAFIEDPEAYQSMMYSWFPGTIVRKGEIACMSCLGPLLKEDYSRMQDGINSLQGDSSLKALILDIDSPGGDVAGCGEAAKKFSEFDRPMVAAGSGQMCSAAYWLASQADYITATESCSVGSIGVLAVHYSLEGMNNHMGVKVTEIARGRKKAQFSANKELSEDAKKELQSQVDYFYDKFAGDVLEKRSVNKICLQSGIFYGQSAVNNSLIDGILNDKSQLLN